MLGAAFQRRPVTRAAPLREQALALLDEMSERGIYKDAAVYRALAHFDATACTTAVPDSAAPATAAFDSATPAAAAAAPDGGDDTG